MSPVAHDSMSSDKLLKPDEFLKLEYQTLREEIRESKSRAFQIVGISLVAVPTAHFLADTYEIDTLVLMLPLLVIVAGLLYLSENHAIMRCGRYIKIHIEPHAPGVTGWERWLSTDDDFEKRTVDRYLTYCFYVIFLVYFIGSMFLASRFAWKKFGVTAGISIFGLYTVMGVLFGVFLRANILLATTTETGRSAAKRRGSSH
jgi:hypothetical protein